MKAKEAPSETVSFRLPATLAKRLSDAGESQDLSSGEYARRLVTEALTDTRHEETSRALSELRATVDRVREDLATVAAALLAKDGPVPTDEAKEWVRTRLLI